MTEINSRSKVAPKSAKVKSKNDYSGPKASEEFGGEIYATDDWQKLKKKHPGGFQTTLLDLEKKDWDGDDKSTWYAVLEGHRKLVKISQPSGISLGEAFGDLMDGWKGRAVHVLPTKYNKGWGAVIDPIVEDEEEPIDDDPDLEDDDENVD